MHVRRTLFKLLLAALKAVPRGLAARLDAPLMARERLTRGRSHPTIPMTLANLVLCSCPDCPSFPEAAGEALYCSGGRSAARIDERGCNRSEEHTSELQSPKDLVCR